jgi:hypothetical protein
MESIGAEHLPALRDLRALTELAYAVIEKRDITGIPEETQRQALRIFHNNLLSAYAGRPSGNYDMYDIFANGKIHGERARDVFSLENAAVDGDHIIVDWLLQPFQVKTDGGKYTYRCEKTMRTKMPLFQGIVASTQDGLYNPETGMPFSTKPYEKVGDNPAFWEAVEKKIAAWGELHEKQIDDAIAERKMKPPSKFHPMFLTQTFNPFPDLDYSDCMHLLRENATYGFSHQKSDARLSPKKDYMVLMRGMDKFMNCDPDCVSIGYNNFGDCGISARFVQYQH